MIKKLLAFTILFSLVSFVSAGTVGKISGLVTDKETGEPLPGVNILIENTNLGGATDMDGEYFVINIPPGVYSVTTSMVGYKPMTVTDVRIIPDRTTTVNFTITSEALTGETITVVAERPLIQRDATFSGSVTSADEIENMPVTSISEVMSTNAGFIVQGYTVDNDGSNSGTESIHVRGGRSNEVVFMVDGFYVKDSHLGGLGTDVPSESVQDLSIITGTFNAEYGEAMSGVVNIITKEGSPEYHGAIRMSSDQFGVSEYDNNTTRGEFNVSGPIPLMKNIANFYFSGDYLDTDTYLHEFVSHVHDAQGNPITRIHNPLTYQKRQRYAGKLVYKPFKNVKTVIGYNKLDQEERLYNDLFKEIPDHNGINYENSDLYNLTISHTLSATTFYNLKASYFDHSYEHKLKDNLDEIVRPVLVGDAFGGTSNYEFYGTYFYGFDNNGDSVWVTSDDDFYQDYNTKELAFMGDISSQIQKHHLVKMGFEYKTYQVEEYRLDLINDDGIGKPDEITHYKFEPIKLSAYVQDKMEFEQFIINAGLRFDYLDPKSEYLPDFTNPDVTTLKKTETKYRFSPRIGFGHPLTEKIRLHFAYGHFYQFPDFNFLYRRMNQYDPNGLIDVTEGYRPRIGNPNLKPQTTIAYEFGTEMALTNEVVADVTVFYKDIYDYISTKFYDVDPRPYVAIENLDYANSKGIEFSIKKRFSDHYSFSVNYTYSRAEGNADDWDTHFIEYQNASVTGQIPPKRTVTLEWDQPHTVNFMFDLRWADSWGVNLLGTFGSGLPYTPTDARGKNIGEVNSARKPWTGTVDMRLNKDFNFMGLRERLFMNVWNLFDKKNVYQVYSNSGKPDYSTNPNASEEAQNNPHWYGPPRQIELGLQLSF
jgi:outer membrane receptor protein involved in Fe transport